MSTLCPGPILRKHAGHFRPHQVINQPGSKPKIFLPERTAWSPVIPPKPKLSDYDVDHKGIKHVRSPSLSTSDVGEKFRRDMINIQRQQWHNEQLMCMQQQLLGQYQLLSLTRTLPHAEVQTFDGDPVNYCNFICYFKNLIKAKTKISNTRLYYQYKSGDVHELMRSCLLLKERYDQNYKISSAYVTRVRNGPPIKHEDGQALQKFSTLRTNCKNALREVGYLSKTENPDSYRKASPSPEAKIARPLSHKVIGTINTERRNQGKTSNDCKPQRSDNFATLGGKPVSENNENRRDITKATPERQLCKEDHWLTCCRQFKKQSVEQRLKFVRKQGLCKNCFQRDHKDRNVGNLCSNEGPINEGDRRATQNNNDNAHKACVNGDSQCALTGDGTSTIGLPIVPVKVKARSADPPVLTYAFLDSGSHTTFCSQTIVTECRVFKLDVFDLNEQNFVELPTVFSTPQLPVSKINIPQQEVASKHPYLKGIRLPKIDAPIGLLIGNNVPNTLEPKKVIASNDRGPYAIKNSLWVDT
ncbi:hypothetical protein P5673_006976 [Acropora cervicornis]|uniref:Uncharacterized protein n=1 Tax=Acropora cervicornis TaxID=6130 RepID=A0AAD9VCI0_ACRCE|nr:hypothetical protein P5673_006976 [Acropora cervicornis]